MAASPEVVKKAVSSDIKKRGLSQVKIAEMMGVTRQTVAGILSSKEYFNEKQASLFSLALGYNKEFLKTGEGTLISDNSEHGMRVRLESQDKLLNIYRKTVRISNLESDLLVKHGAEKCKPLLSKTHQMYGLITTIENFPPLYINYVKNLPYDPELVDGAERIFQRLYEQIRHILEEVYHVEVEISSAQEYQ